MTDDLDGALLKKYALHRDEAAFEQVVQRHAHLVYATALRLVGAGSAEDIVQMVFQTLAQKADEVSARQSAAGWLHTVTRFTAAKFVRTETRRTAREREVIAMDIEQGSVPPIWTAIGQHLDEALGSLDETDRAALLLRFFEGRPHIEVARALKISEEAAQKRVGRALERLRCLLLKKEPTLTASSLAAAITTNCIHACPSKLLSTAILCGALPSATSTPLALTTFMTAKTKVIAATALITAGLLTPTLLWRKQSGIENTPHAVAVDLSGSLAEKEAALHKARAEIELYKQQAAEVHTLRAELNRLKAVATAPQPTAAPPPDSAATAAHPPAYTFEQITDFIGKLRARRFAGTPYSAEEREWLANARSQLEALEQRPQEFATFQTALVQNALGISDPTKLEAIRGIIERTYDQAVAEKLDIPSKPSDAADDWRTRRHALDRSGTKAVQELLTADERAQFDRAFLGIMGVDLGNGVNESNYAPGFIQPSNQPRASDQ